MSREQLERNQIWVYAAGLLLGATLGLVRPGLGSSLEVVINPVLGVLLYTVFLQVPFREILEAFTHGRYMAAVLTANFLVVPVVVWLLARFVPQEPAILIGVYIVLLTPCIDYVIVFTGIGGGDDRLALASTPALMLAQIVLLPALHKNYIQPQDMVV